MMDYKVTQDHLTRNAYLYVRQSTLHQVIQNRESTERQYALKHRAQLLGWDFDKIFVIDDDLGQSGARSEGRKGFQHLVAEVSLGHAGVVMGLEVSRLARNNADWHRLLEICGISHTLILDEDGLYDPAEFNDRLLLGLKGTMSEAELHFLRARLQGGIINKARRGELQIPLPVGYVYNENGKQVLDPDQRVRDAVAYLFETFKRTGSARAVVRHFKEKGLLFPGRGRGASPTRDIGWLPLEHYRVLSILKNPRYAGAYVFGETKSHKDPISGKVRAKTLPQDKWMVFIPDAHDAYITWENYLENRRKLTANATSYSQDRRHGPPRTGPALLQGLVICGKCGERMTVHYRSIKNSLKPYYICQRRCIESATQVCQVIPGCVIDEKISEILLETITPLNIETAIEVFEEIRSRRIDVVRMHRCHLDQARQDAEMAHRRFLRVNPDNRLVADNLERDWNQKLQIVSAIEDEYSRIDKDQTEGLSSEQATRVYQLANDFPRIWKDQNVSMQDRKRIVRLILEDITLLKTDLIDVKIRFRSGSTREVRIPIPPKGYEKRKASVSLINRLQEMSRTMTNKQIVQQLNAEGIKSPCGFPFNRIIVENLLSSYHIPGPYSFLRERGFLTVHELAAKLGVHPQTISNWARRGLIKNYPYNDHGWSLYEDPGPAGPIKGKWKQKGKDEKVCIQTMGDKQYEA